MPRNSEIPRFDLAEEILAEQRKITAIRRKAPNKAARLGGGSPSRSGVARRSSLVPRPSFLSGLFPEQQQIITEIVARDIENLNFRLSIAPAPPLSSFVGQERGGRRGGRLKNRKSPQDA